LPAKGRIILLALACALLLPFGIVSMGAFLRPGVAGPVSNPADFRAFACGARVMAEGGDPYRTEPLRTCEQGAARAFGLAMFDGLVLPAPLPPYALLAFEPLGLLPFPAASLVWLALSLAAIAFSSVALARLGALPLPAAAAAMLGAAAYVSLPLGQVVPLVVALLSGAALAARAGRFALAGVLCALATVEPHVGLPACAALALGESRARRTLAVCALVALVASVALAGPSLWFEYVRDVLPAHARSQVDQFGVQYSLTALLFALGANGTTALAAGSISYVAMAVSGIALAGLLAKRYGDEAFLVLLPPAFALVLGAFVHLAQMAVALPAVGLVIAHARTPVQRRLAYAALFALAIPWGAIVDSGAFAAQLAPHASAPRRVALPAADAAALAEKTESDFMAGGGYGSNGVPLIDNIYIKCPTWIALLGLIALSIRLLPARRAAT
jgi:hypothetical protein